MFARKNSKSDDTAAAKSSGFDRALKWVTALTAVLSLFFAIQKVTQTIDENASRTQNVNELLRVATMQQQAMDYARAWESLANASQLAEAGDALAKLLGQHAADSARIRAQREELAMSWLMNIRLAEGEQFTTIVDKLTPVLEAGTGNAPPRRKADLLAHIGWSYFLRNRDGHHAFEPSHQYSQALALDAHNPYAHAYWAHWLLWQNDEIDKAREHFVQALQSDRAREQVRDMQLVAFNNLGPRGEPLFVATIIDMQKNAEPIAAPYRIAARRMFENACGNYGKESLAALKAQVAAADLAAAYAQLTEPIPDDEKTERAQCLERLQAG